MHDQGRQRQVDQPRPVRHQRLGRADARQRGVEPRRARRGDRAPRRAARRRRCRPANSSAAVPGPASIATTSNAVAEQRPRQRRGQPIAPERQAESPACDSCQPGKLERISDDIAAAPEGSAARAYAIAALGVRKRCGAVPHAAIARRTAPGAHARKRLFSLSAYRRPRVGDGGERLRHMSLDRRPQRGGAGAVCRGRVPCPIRTCS